MAAAAVESKSVLEDVMSMKNRIQVAELLKNSLQYLNKYVVIGGWVRASRSVFFDISDGSTALRLQVVAPKEVTGSEHVKPGVALVVFGKFVASNGKGQAYEIQAERISLTGRLADKYPMSAVTDATAPDTLRNLAHLRPRVPWVAATFRIRSNLAYATHLYFRERNFFYVHTPLITSADCEGAGEMFQVTTALQGSRIHPDCVSAEDVNAIDYTADFFKKAAYLTVSGQLNVEAFCCALDRVYTFSPTFRAEKSHTSRHLAEFWMIEPEIAFADLEDDMNLAESYLKFVLNYVLLHNDEDLAILEAAEQRRRDARAAELKAEAAARQKEEKARKDAEKKAKKEAAAAKKEAEPATTGDAPAAESKENNNQQQQQQKQQKPKQQQQQKQQQKQKQNQKQKQAAEQQSLLDAPLRARLKHVATSPFARITYTEAVERVQKALKEGRDFGAPEKNVLEWGDDLASEHERYLCEQVFQCPVFVRNYPRAIKAFYMRANDDADPSRPTVAAMDLLVPGVGELMGGSQREERLDKLEARLEQMEADAKRDGKEFHKDGLDWYVDLRRWGSVPHAGFGVGFGRLVCYATGLEHIRDVIPFPRYHGKCDY